MKEMKKLNLQFFAEPENTITSNESSSEEQTTQSQEEKKSQDKDEQPKKIFSEDEVETIVRERLKREKEKLPSKERLEALEKWEQEQKTTEERRELALEEAQRTAREANEKLAKYERMNAIRQHNIGEDFVGYIDYEVSIIAKENDIPYKEALTKFMKQHGDKYIQNNPAKLDNTKEDVTSAIISTGAKQKEDIRKKIEPKTLKEALKLKYEY